MGRLPAAALLALLVSAGCAPSSMTDAITVGAVFPLSGPQAALARQEYVGVQIARDFVNADGGVGGRRIELIARDVTVREDVAAQVQQLRDAGARLIIGAYSSSLSMPVSEATESDGLLYWEAGAVADQLTGRGYPLVFRVGATGRNLGAMSSHFAASVLAPRLGRQPRDLRMVIVHARDLYPASVAVAARAQADREGLPVVATVDYDLRNPDWGGVMTQIRAAHPDVLVLASYIPDGVSFRRAMLADGLHVGALIGSTMAECGPEFGAMLGGDAIGVFASDRPASGFNPSALTATGRSTYERFASAYRQQSGADPTEEALAGFSAAWTLFHYVMPAARSMTPEGLAQAARGLDLSSGTLANGAGVLFASSPDARGQNVRAASVIWQWQAVRHSVVVYPPVFATGTPAFVPLPR